MEVFWFQGSRLARFYCVYYCPDVHVCAAGLCICLCMCAYIIYVAKKLAVWGLTTWKPPVSVIYCSLVKYNSQKGAHYARWFIQGKKFRSNLLTGREMGSVKLYYDKPCLVYMQCSYEMPANAEQQHATAVQTYNITTGTVCIDSD